MFGRISVNLYTLALLGKSKPLLRYSLWVLLFLQTVFNVVIAFTLLGVCGTDMLVIAKLVDRLKIQYTTLHADCSQ